MGTVHYLSTARNKSHLLQRWSELQFGTVVLGSRLNSYTEATVSFLKARDELDKWHGFFGSLKRFFHPMQYMLVVEAFTRAENKQREAYRNFIKARNKFHE